MEAAENLIGYVTASVRHFMTKTTSEADLPLGQSDCKYPLFGESHAS